MRLAEKLDWKGLNKGGVNQNVIPIRNDRIGRGLHNRTQPAKGRYTKNERV
jgi:hypothetical protein